MTLRHNELRDNIGAMLQEVTNDVRIEPILQSRLERNNQWVEMYQWKHKLISAQEHFGLMGKGHFSM